MFWYNQRPLLIGDALYVAARGLALLMFRLDRRTGKVVVVKRKGEGSSARTDGGPTSCGADGDGRAGRRLQLPQVEQNWAGPYEGGGSICSTRERARPCGSPAT